MMAKPIAKRIQPGISMTHLCTDHISEGANDLGQSPFNRTERNHKSNAGYQDDCHRQGQTHQRTEPHVYRHT